MGIDHEEMFNGRKFFVKSIITFRINVFDIIHIMFCYCLCCV